MGLREAFHDAATAIMKAADNVPEICILHHILFDSTTGQMSGTQDITGVRVVAEQYLVEKVEDAAQIRNTRQYRAVSSDLGGVEPLEDDTLTFPDGGSWVIFAIQPDPARASYLLHVRR